MVGGYRGSIRIVQLAMHWSPGRGYQPYPGSMFGRQEESMMTEGSVPRWRLIRKRVHPAKR